MDVIEPEQVLRKHSIVETPIPQLFRTDRNKSNGTTCWSRTREVSYGYISPSRFSSSDTQTCHSPNSTRTRTTSSASVPKRAISAERTRPSMPLSPRIPSTPPHDTTTDMQLTSKKIMGSRLPEVLWPSTMRSLSVSFQSDSFSVSISKKEKPVTPTLSDHTLRPSSNVAHKQDGTPSVSRKPTPARRSPLKGKNSVVENSKPAECLHARVVDQHRWPSRTGGKVSFNALTKRTDLKDKIAKVPSLPHHGTGMPAQKRMSLADTDKLLQESSSLEVRPVSFDGGGKVDTAACSFDGVQPRVAKLGFPSSLEKITSQAKAVRSQSFPTLGSRPPSPSKMPSPTSTAVSPSRARALNPSPSRGPSPSQIRSSSPSRKSKISSSVLGFIVDMRKGKKGTNQLEDAHQLRLLYNRHLQWCYANARTEAVLHSQKLKAEKILFNVWRTTLELWDSVTEKRIDLQRLRLKLKLFWLLHEQMAYMNEWALIERDHTAYLSRAIEDLQASTLRLPLTGGARGDIETVRAAVCSAVDVMQEVRSSICSTLSRVEDMNCLVSELADVAAKERAKLDECKALLASSTTMQQVEEYSLKTHFLQLKQAWKNDEEPTFAN